MQRSELCVMDKYVKEREPVGSRPRSNLGTSPNTGLTTIVLAFVLLNAYLSLARTEAATPQFNPLSSFFTAIDSRQQQFISDCITRIIIILRILRHPG